MNELIERLEKAMGPDRELDALIRQSVYCPQGYVEQSPINGAWCVYDGSRDRSGRARLFKHWPSRDAKCGAFTASIDAALTLKRPGQFLDLLTECNVDGLAIARICGTDGVCFTGVAKTLPNAATIAALKAHSTGMERKNDD